MVHAIRLVGLKDPEGHLSLKLLAEKVRFKHNKAQDMLTTCLEGMKEGIMASLDQKP
jgi:hypothetical protein